MTSRGRHRRVVAPPTRLGTSEEADLTPSEPPARRARRDPRDDAPSGPAPSSGQRAADRPAVPAKASEDTDEAWGQPPGDSDDARLLRDKPPHW